MSTQVSVHSVKRLFLSHTTPAVAATITASVKEMDGEIIPRSIEFIVFPDDGDVDALLIGLRDNLLEHYPLESKPCAHGTPVEQEPCAECYRDTDAQLGDLDEPNKCAGCNEVAWPADTTDDNLCESCSAREGGAS